VTSIPSRPVPDYPAPECKTGANIYSTKDIH
jgi:hypothetical protein